MTNLFNQLDNATYQIINAETFSTLKTYEPQKFDLIITSPPYNVGEVYETKTSIEKYLETQEEIPSVKANYPEKTEHPCQFPVEFVDQYMLAIAPWSF